jgi:hypothetical protein
MGEFLIIETRDAADHRDTERTLDLACGLSRAGNATTVLLTENGAFNARRSSHYATGKAVKDGVRVLVDSFALGERGIVDEDLQKAISPGNMDSVVDHLIKGSHVIWR